MRRIFTLLLVCALMAGLNQEVTAQRAKCNAQEWHHDKMHSDPIYAAAYAVKQRKFQQSMKQLEQLKQQRAPGDCPTDKIVIPVAVHYQYAAPGSQQACLIQLAQDQINVLNEAYSGNSCGDAGVGSCLKFELANQNHPASSGLPNGVPAVLFGSDPCPTGAPAPCTLGDWTGYLNLVVQSSSLAPNLLGVASLAGAPDGTNGVLISSCAWGTSNTTCTAGLTGAGAEFIGTAGCAGFAANIGGTTATHEVGHYMNLLHTFCVDGQALGINENSTSTGSVTTAMEIAACQNPAICGGGCVTALCDCDDVTDTPAQAFAEYGCASGNTTNTSPNPSTGVDYAYNNFMDYTDDACMNCFTPMQKDRVVAQCNATRSQYATNKIAGPNPPADPIPTLSQWGLLIIGLLMLNLGVIFMYRGGLATLKK